MRHVIGIDAGGTKTIGLLADESGQVQGEARAGGANLQTHGELEVEKVLHEIIESLSPDRPVDAVCLGMAGVDRPRDHAVVRHLLRRLGHRETARVVNDAVIALVAGAAERFGIVILAGTGSIAYGEDRQGRSARAGGFGSLLADEGSGYWLGHQVMRAAVRGSDGRGPRTALQGLLFGALGIQGVAELVPLVYEKGMPKTQIAALAGLVETARQQGDTVAVEILQQGALELSLAARSVALQLAFREPFTVVLAGGVFKACPSLPSMVDRALQVPGAQVKVLELEPAQGAVWLACDLLRRPEAGGAA
ncbi:MAG: N-acetylglucosamine kinase [Vicinamibacteria bacterium]